MAFFVLGWMLCVVLVWRGPMLLFVCAWIVALQAACRCVCGNQVLRCDIAYSHLLGWFVVICCLFIVIIINVLNLFFMNFAI